MSPGFGLLEILAALTVLAISMLALTNGLLNAQQHSVESSWLTQASLQAENIYERMLSNNIGRQQGDYYQTPGSTPSCQVCSPHEQAAKDLTQWQQQLQKFIPESEQSILPFSQGQEININWLSPLRTESEKRSEWITYVGSQ